MRAKWRAKNRELANLKELMRKQKEQYGEFAEIHRVLLTLSRQVKAKEKNEKSKSKETRSRS
jgi:hypothetical protein